MAGSLRAAWLPRVTQGWVFRSQAIVATHSPLLMAVPGARILETTRFGFLERDYRDTSHFKLWRAFTADPDGFVAEMLDEAARDDVPE